jgi:uncharacterized protein YpmB
LGTKTTRKKEKKMSEGFSQEKIEVKIYKDEVKKLLKKYKKIKKYQRSSIFEVKTMDGTENYVSKLIREVEEGS